MRPIFRSFVASALLTTASFIPNRPAAAQSPTASPIAENASSDAPRILSLRGGKFSIDLSRYPVSGSVTTKNVVVIISDFTCPHSRETEKAFVDALNGFKPGEVALVHLPGTREKKDGPSIHKIMLALWQEHPAIYRRLSAQMIYEDLPAEPQKVRAAAAAAVGGPTVLDALLKKHSVEADAEIELASRLMTANADSPASVALPQTMIGERLITGSILNPAELQTNIEEQFGITPAHLVYTPQQLPPNPDDPCDPTTRQTCGRLVISIIGAGEVISRSNVPKNTTVNGDTHGRDARAHLLHFTADATANLPSEHILITSDPEIKAWVRKIPFKGKASLAGVADNSIPAFERMVSPETSDSPLNKALAFFERNTECKKLMKGGRSVSPFLKVDIVVDGEGVASEWGFTHEYPPGISTFKTEGTVGTMDRWKDDGTVLGEKELSPLFRRLSGSLIHVFIKACKAGIIQTVFDNAIDKTTSCGCVLAVSDNNQDFYSGGDLPAAFNLVMPDQGEQIRKVPVFGKWAHADSSVVKMAPSLLEYHKGLIMNPLDSDDPSSSLYRNLIGIEYKNPLFGFAHTSADALSRRLLELWPWNSAHAPEVQAIEKSEFVSEIEKVRIPQIAEQSFSTPLDANIARIRERLSEVKEQLGSIWDHDSQSKLDSSVFERELDAFDGCLKADAASAPEYCAVFGEIWNSIKEKNASNTPISPEERLFAERWNDFISYLNYIKVLKIWRHYISGEIKLSEFLSRMPEAKRKLLEFDKTWSSLCSDAEKRASSKGERESVTRKRRALAYLNDSFEKAFNSVRTQLFDQLKKESTTTKLLRTEAAVDLLAANIDSIDSREEAEKVVARLASKLNCLTWYKVGPAHDQQPPGPVVLYQEKR